MYRLTNKKGWYSKIKFNDVNDESSTHRTLISLKYTFINIHKCKVHTYNLHLNIQSYLFININRYSCIDKNYIASH